MQNILRKLIHEASVSTEVTKTKKSTSSRSSTSKPRTVREGSGSSRIDSSGTNKFDGGEATVHSTGDSEESHEKDSVETWGTESSTRSESGLGVRIATNALTGRVESPFTRVPMAVRGRAEEMTGRTLEESYEGFTENLVGAIDKLYADIIADRVFEQTSMARHEKRLPGPGEARD